MNKARYKKRISQTVKATAIAVLAVALVFTVWYVWIVQRRPAAKPTVIMEVPKTPQEYCAPAGGICLTAPAGWINYAVDNASFMDLGPSADTVHIYYYQEASTKVTACQPGDCLLAVFSIENFAPIADTVFVKGVLERPAYGVNQPQEFLLSTADVQRYGLKAGVTSDLGEEATYAFNRVVDGRRHAQSLEVSVHKPGNYGSLEEAKSWFDTPEAKDTDRVIATLKLN